MYMYLPQAFNRDEWKTVPATNRRNSCMHQWYFFLYITDIEWLNIF